MQQFYRWAAELVRMRQLDAVWDLGDTTDDRSALSHPVIQSVTQGCAALTAGLKPVLNYKLLGNHEQHVKGGQTHVGGLFHPYFHVVEDRGVYTLPRERVHLVCMSYPQDAAEAAQWIHATIENLIEEDRQQIMRIIVLGHFTVKGVSLSSGIATAGVPRDAFKGADLVLLGHVHRRQLLPDTSRGGYIGSPFQQDFGEAQDPAKCVAILDTATLELEWIPTPFPTYRTVTVQELPRAVQSNDVLRVMLRSPEDARQLYASPAAGSVQPVYAFDADREETPQGAPAGLDFDSLTRAYTTLTPLPGSKPDELLAWVSELK